ncbi:MAG: penicillin-binding protein [Chloroflexota bacterium]|nr:penicillin-binding protein [Chloroflexota bacterium]
MPPVVPVPLRVARAPTRHPASRVVALRHVNRAATRRAERPRSRLPRILAAILVGFGLVTTITVAVAVMMLSTAVGVLSVGLPDPNQLQALTFAQPTVIYDRSGKVELGRFSREDRRVVTFTDVPRLLLDATTTAEDRTFWSNAGFDMPAIVSAVAQGASGAGERGASTITQQLVRARLLPLEVTGPGADRYLRKAKELIQSMRLAEAFPGQQGKERVITAYLNEIFYGHGAYGIAAAAQVYFGVADLNQLTPAQAALLAGLPKSPSILDPFRYAVADKQGRLVVPPGSAPVARRDWVLHGLADGGRWTKLTPMELQTALAEPVILKNPQARAFKAAHFTWQVRRQLDVILGGADAVETGGYRVITTLDWKAQQLAEKWLTAAAVVPNVSRRAGEAMLKTMRIPRRELGWIRGLRGKDLHNGALVALDYRTGDVLAYSGSAGYARDNLASPKFAPKFDVAGDGSRQPGSAFKPIIYASAFDNRRLTPSSLLLDVSTQFNARENWAPHDADKLERGPVLVRKALQYSLNIPTIRALQRVGNDRVARTAEAFGLRFTGGRTAFLQSGLAGALGTVEVRPLDLTSAYGAIANGGVRVPPRMILEVIAPDGTVVWHAPDPQGTKAVSPQAAFLVTDILAGNTDKAQNPIWAEKLALFNGKGGSRRPAAVKTGTSNDAADLATYGFLAAPSGGQPALAVGIWMGNSDHSNPRSKTPAISLTAAAPLWHAFVQDYTNGWPVAQFRPPKGVVRATVDAWSGGAPGPWTRDTTTAWFIAGTQPGAAGAVDPNGLLYAPGCGGWTVDLVKAELGPTSWQADVADWMRRAAGGPGRLGAYGSRTAYFWGKSSWGGPLGACSGQSAGSGSQASGGQQGKQPGAHHKKKSKKPKGGPPTQGAVIGAPAPGTNP